MREKKRRNYKSNSIWEREKKENKLFLINQRWWGGGKKRNQGSSGEGVVGGFFELKKSRNELCNTYIEKSIERYLN